MKELIYASLPIFLSILALMYFFVALRINKKRSKDSESSSNYGALGMCIGMCIGGAIGSAFGNFTQGMCPGMLFGLAVGTAFEKRTYNKSEEGGNSKR